jgi:hypothetical protein
MITQLVQLQLPWTTTSASGLRDAIEAQLSQYGDPLRWAITHVDADQQWLAIEAVVTLNPSSQPEA